MPTTKNVKIEWIKSTPLNNPELSFYQPKENKKLISKLLRPISTGKNCQGVCTKIIELLPATIVEPRSGVGYHMINVDGFRFLNAYVISDALNSTLQRGFTLDISFSVHDFVYGVGVVGETEHFFNFDNYYNPGEYRKRTVHIGTSDQTSQGGLTRIGGVDYTQLLRVPIMGPYVRASVMNEDSVDREVCVKAYLTT